MASARTRSPKSTSVPPLGPDEAWFNLTEAAVYLRLSPAYLRKLRKLREGPAVHAFGSGQRKRLVYRRADLDVWAASHRGNGAA